MIFNINFAWNLFFDVMARPKRLKLKDEEKKNLERFLIS